ncbi:MAG: hypothetical protein ACLSEE_13445, partial [Blautia hansenii]
DCSRIKNEKTDTDDYLLTIIQDLQSYRFNQTCPPEFNRTFLVTLTRFLYGPLSAGVAVFPFLSCLYAVVFS